MQNVSYSDFKSNFKQIQEIKQFINKDSIQKDVLLIVGEHSTGKTFLSEIIQNIDTMETIVLNDTNCSEEIIYNFANSKTIVSMFRKTNKKCIFIDDINNILFNDKSFVTYFSSQVSKSKCKFIITVRTSEEKKLSSIKKTVTHKVYLNLLNYKECFQLVLSKVEDNSNIDTDKLLTLVKNLNCNIPKIFQLIESTYYTYDVKILENEEDVFHDNIYSVIKILYSKECSNKEIFEITLKDSQLLSLLMHENLTSFCYKQNDIDTLIKMYSVITDCDIIDKHIYINCNWGINFIMINYYRFSSINQLLKKHYKTDSTIAFTKQFTQLSSQTSTKKKLLAYYTTFLQKCLIDFLLYSLTNKFHTDKLTKDFATKFSKDFKIKSL